MDNIDLVTEHQKQWADEYRRALADHNVPLDTAQAEADHQLELLQQSNLDPQSSDDWESVDEAVSQYLAAHPFSDAPAAEENTLWSSLSYVGTLIATFSVAIPISDWIGGDFSWQIDLSNKTIIFFAFTLLLISVAVTSRVIYFRRGLTPALLATAPLLVAAILVLYLPIQIWDKQALKSPYATMPTLLAMALGILLGIAVNMLVKKLEVRQSRQRALKMWELHQGHHTDQLNRIWLSELEEVLRTSYYYNSALINPTLRELSYHLSQKNTSAKPVLAEEEFGKVRQFAHQLASNNHRAIVHAKRNELLEQVFFLVVCALALFGGIMGLVSGESSAGSWFMLLIVLLIAIFGTGLFTLSTIAHWQDWKAARKRWNLS